MRWKLWFGRILTRWLPPQEIVDLAAGVWPHIWKRIPQDQRVDFLKSVAQKHAGMLTAGLSHRERVVLMNALMPIAVREFPLVEMDFLSAFAATGERYNPEHPDG